MADLGNHLGDALGDAVEGDNHIELVQSRQGHQGIALGKALAVKQILVRGIPVDNLGPGKPGAQFLAPGGIAFHDDTANAGL